MTKRSSKQLKNKKLSGEIVNSELLSDSDIVSINKKCTRSNKIDTKQKKISSKKLKKIDNKNNIASDIKNSYDCYSDIEKKYINQCSKNFDSSDEEEMNPNDEKEMKKSYDCYSNIKKKYIMDHYKNLDSSDEKEMNPNNDSRDEEETRNKDDSSDEEVKNKDDSSDEEVKNKDDSSDEEEMKNKDDSSEEEMKYITNDNEYEISSYSSSYDNVSSAFIKTTGNDWDLASKILSSLNNHQFGIPNINNIPVISCIGTSRDGKSTLLNIYAKYITNNPYIMPFESYQSDDNITNGIDFFTIPNNCILFDCQGMQLGNAKYDHFLMIVTYILSDVMILNVRERLDTQILNNFIPIFSFIDEACGCGKQNKIKLIVRIKDFQNNKALDDDPEYLNKLVDKWLMTTNDQYQQIKTTFREIFDIYPIVTKYPTLDHNDNVDISDINLFFRENPTFGFLCNKIYELSGSIDIKKENRLSPEKIKKLINYLKNNKNIDHKKLDTYYQIEISKLTEYLNKELIPYFKKIKINEKDMNGTVESYNIYKSFEKKIKEIKCETYTEKFGSVPNNIKKDVFDKIFDEQYSLINKCMLKNHTLAKDKLSRCSKFDSYIRKYYNDNKLLKLSENIMDIFEEYSVPVKIVLDTIDADIAYIERKNLKSLHEKLIVIIDTIQNNTAQNNEFVTSLIKEYNTSGSMKKIIIDSINIDIEKEQYNRNIDEVIKFAKKNIMEHIHEIIWKNKKLYYLDDDMDVAACETFKYKNCDVLAEKEYMESDEKYREYYLHYKNKQLTSVGCLPNISFEENTGIKFVGLALTKTKKILMTQNFYNKMYDSVIKSIEDKYAIIKFVQISKTSHLIKYVLKINEDYTHLDGKFCKELIDPVINDFFKEFILFIKNNITTNDDKNLFKFKVLEKISKKN